MAASAYRILRHKGELVSEPKLPVRTLGVYSPLLGHESPHDYSIPQRKAAVVALADCDISLAEELRIGFAMASYGGGRLLSLGDEDVGADGSRSVTLSGGQAPDLIVLSAAEAVGKRIVLGKESRIGAESLFTASGAPANAIWHVGGQAELMLNLRDFGEGSVAYRPLSEAFPAGRIVPVAITVSAHLGQDRSGQIAPADDSEMGPRYSVRLSVAVP